MTATDYYKVLNVTRQSSLDEIQRAYRKFALKYHPMKQQEGVKDRSQFDTISEAYDILSNPERRAVYDQYGHDALTQGMRVGQLANVYPGGYVFSSRKADELFSAFFGTQNPFEAAFAPAHLLMESLQTSKKDATVAKDDLESAMVLPGRIVGKCPNTDVLIPVTLEELYRGAMKKVKVSKSVYVDGQEPQVTDKTFTLEIQKGWKAGTKVVYQGEGDKRPSMTPGDVVLIIEEAAHPRFKRSGNDLIYTHNIHLSTALCGSIIAVPTLDDRTVQVAVNDVVTPDSMKVVPGEGMPISKKPGQRGDLIIKFNIEFPKYLSEKQKSLVKEAF